MSLISVFGDAAGMPAVLIAALIVDAAALIAIVAVVVALVCRRSKKKKVLSRASAPPTLSAHAPQTDVPTDRFAVTEPVFAAADVKDTAAPPVGVTRTAAPPVPAKLVYVTYDRSFYAKLAQADDGVKARYTALKNELLSYGGVRARLSWAYDSFYAGRDVLARLAVRGKTLSLYLALNMAALDPNFRCEFAGDVKRYARTPVRLRIRSDAAARRAARVIALAAAEKNLTQGERAAVAYAPPYESTESLAARGLVKVLATADEGTQAVKADFGAFGREKFKRVEGVAIRASVTAEQAAAALSDETAATLVERAARPAQSERRGRKGIVNVDTLSRNFASGELVTLAALQSRGLIAARAARLKVLARGTLDKPLIVEASEFSPDAVKMIALTGGRAVRV